MVAPLETSDINTNQQDGVPEAASLNGDRLEIDNAVNLLGHGRFQRRVLIAAGLCFSADAGKLS